MVSDNLKISIEATDADSDSLNQGQVILTFVDTQGNKTTETIVNTNDMTTKQLWAKTQEVLNKAIETYNKNEKPL